MQTVINREYNDYFLKKANQLRPVLNERVLHAKKNLTPLKKGDTILFDFGEHLAGYITLSFGTRGSHPDAPAWIRIKAAEMPRELEENVEDYHGWVSASWVQQEQIHIDCFPCEISMPRRYAFRYLQIEVLAISEKYELVVEDASCRAVSSADDENLLPYEGNDSELKEIYRISCRTLHDCMQDVFEDGPKRDRRLWMGDLRLQALANYRTYRNYDLVKRCLYLFAGCTLPGGRVGASMFIEPEVEADDIYMFDYSLLFIPTLLEYYEATGDKETLTELMPTAIRQAELSRDHFDENDLIRDSDQIGWCFLDWNLGLNKQAGAQGVYLYCIKSLIRLAEILGDAETAKKASAEYEKKKRSALSYLFDSSEGLFVSGKDRQISWVSQIIMVLAGVSGREVLDRVEKVSEAVGIVTPYMYHFYIQALMDTDQKEKAIEVIRSYWGGMVREGADTFWELYNPDNPMESPYGGTIVNSYCHAWSCTAACFI